MYECGESLVSFFGANRFDTKSNPKSYFIELSKCKSMSLQWTFNKWYLSMVLEMEILTIKFDALVLVNHLNL